MTLGADLLLHKFLGAAQIQPFFRTQIVRRQGIPRQPQRSEPQYFPGVLADVFRFLFFASAACPFEEVVSDLLSAFGFFFCTAKTPTERIKVGYEGFPSDSPSLSL
jgi:hypothetical protein